MDAETQGLLRGSIRDLFADGDDDITTGLDELGWSEVVADDAAVAIDLLFNEQGAAGKASSALDTVAHARASGAIYPVIHPVGAQTAAVRAGSQLDIDGVLLADVDQPAVSAGPDGCAYLIDLDTLRSAMQSVAGFHAASRLRRVRLSLDIETASAIDIDWPAVVAAARRALAAELVGNGTAMLRLATDQIANRHQFGRPIGANQSPRHRLAECYALLGGAQALVRMAWQSNSAGDARAAKAYAGHAVDATSRACLQVCGAIGLTTEHQLPGYVQRARILDALYGGWSVTMHDIGRELLQSVAVPIGDRL